MSNWSMCLSRSRHARKGGAGRPPACGPSLAATARRSPSRRPERAAVRAAVLLLTALVALAGGCSSSSSADLDTPLLDSYSFWPPPPNDPRIQFLRAYRLSSDVEKPRTAIDRIVFGDDVQPLPIGKPYGVAMWNERLYICDINNSGVVILDLAERQTRVMLTRGVERMVQPTDIAVADDGMKYVVDRRLGRIFVFDADDRHVSTFGDSDLVPAGIAVHGDEIFVPDFETQSVLVLDRIDGSIRRSVGGPDEPDAVARDSEGPDGFVRPLGIDVDAQGAVFVADVIRGRLQKFAADGEFLFGLGRIGDSPGSFVRPKHISVDADGVIYVVDAAFQNVQMFGADGELLMFFGGVGDFAGSMSLPAGIAVHDGGLEHFSHLVHPAFEAKRLVIVTNQFGLNKVSVYALGSLRPGKTVRDIAPYAVDFIPVAPAEEAPEAASP